MLFLRKNRTQDDSFTTDGNSMNGSCSSGLIILNYFFIDLFGYFCRKSESNGIITDFKTP